MSLLASLQGNEVCFAEKNGSFSFFFFERKHSIKKISMKRITCRCLELHIEIKNESFS